MPLTHPQSGILNSQFLILNVRPPTHRGLEAWGLSARGETADHADRRRFGQRTRHGEVPLPHVILSSSGPRWADKTRDDKEGRFVELSPKEERAAYMPPLQTVSNGGCRGGIYPARVEVCLAPLIDLIGARWFMSLGGTLGPRAGRQIKK